MSPPALLGGVRARSSRRSSRRSSSRSSGRASRRIRALAPVLALVLVLAVALIVPGLPARALAQSGAGMPSAARGELEPVPEPSLEGAEAGLQRRIEAARKHLEEIRGKVAEKELADAYGELGSLYLLSELQVAAEAALLNAWRLDPSEVRWPYFLGVLRLDLMELEGAIEALEAARTLRPQSATLVLRLAEARRMAGELDAARQAFESALRGSLSAGEEAFARYALGRIALDQGRFEAAVEHLEAVREAVPEASAVARVLGLAYRELGRTDEARREMAAGGVEQVPLPDRLVAELMQKDAGVYLPAAVKARLGGDYEEAIRLYRLALEESRGSPEAAEILRALAELLFVTGERQAAVDALEKAVELAPESGALWVKLGELLALSGRPAEAEAPYRRALELDEASAEAQLGLGRALAMSGRHGEALPFYRRSLELEPESVEARALLARALAKLERQAEAAEELETALRLDPGNVRLRLAHVDALAAAGDTLGVRNTLEAGVAANDDPRLVATLVQVLIGDPDPARRDPERAVRLASELVRREPSVAHGVVLARALFAAGRVGEAVSLQEEALEAARSSGAAPAEIQGLEQMLEIYRSRLGGTEDSSGGRP